MDPHLRQLLGVMSATMVNSAVVAGVRCGLFDALRPGEWMNPAAIAAAASAHPRCVREWCLLLSSAGVLEWRVADGSLLVRCPEAVRVALVDKASSQYVGGIAVIANLQTSEPDRLASFLQSGQGFEFGALGTFPELMEDLNRARFTHHLADSLAPVLALLTRPNVRVADLGCCSGQLLRSLAHGNPSGMYVGFDIDANFLAHGRRVLQQPEHAAVAPRISFVCVDRSAPAQLDPHAGTFDLVLSSDVLHDAVDPLQVVALAYRLLRGDGHGVYAALEPRVQPTLEKQLKDPTSCLKYGFSLHSCLPSSMASAGGPQLGTLGLSTAIMTGLAVAAGFAQPITVHEPSKDTFNSCFVLTKPRTNARL